ncbi:MAG TPA: thioredoxin [Planctomycetaceae bacterium]|nr:thioredoxin [Planctomycetaceae bacterium]
MPDASPWIKNSTSQTFEADVLLKSSELPVVVDFWAPWCGPCRQLGPLLEKLANEYAGKFLLVKVDIEAEQQIASLFQIQQIPLVVAFRDGQLANEFLGVLPEAQLREWLGTFIPSPAQAAMAEGLKLEATNPQAAEAKFREALTFEPTSDGVKIALVRVIIAQNRDEEASRIIAQLQERGFLEPEAQHLKDQLELRAASAESGGVEEARRAVAANPNDLSLQIALADALAVNGKHVESLELCLSLIARDKAGIGPQAKDAMVMILGQLGPASELAGDYRRKLATAWY